MDWKRIRIFFGLKFTKLILPAMAAVCTHLIAVPLLEWFRVNDPTFNHGCPEGLNLLILHILAAALIAVCCFGALGIKWFIEWNWEEAGRLARRET